MADAAPSSDSADSGAPAAGAPPRVHPALRTRFCELVGVDYPIVQTGMGWVAGPRLGGAPRGARRAGHLASGANAFPELAAAVGEVRSRTDRPFGVNMRT